MPVTPMSPAPSRYDSVNFVSRFENLLTVELPRFITELNALQISTNAATAAGQTAAESARDQSVSARDLAIAAWGASMAPAETLPAISKTIHSGAIVKTFIYDTSKDSDGGAWRKRGTDKSWYTETICTGQWRSQLANLAAAWAVTGAAAGDFYQNTTDGKFYMIGGTIGAQTQTEVTRGNVREFPEQVAIVMEYGRVIFYDLTQPNTPMWMVFVGVLSTSWVYTGLSGLAALNGKVWTGSLANGVLIETDFIQDSGWQWYSSPTYTGPIISKISSRNAGEPSKSYGNTTRGVLGNSAVNDIAAAVLDGAPVDPATGLPIPTIAVATNGGVSVIKHDGTVVNSATTTGIPSVGVSRNRLAYGHLSGQTYTGYAVDLRAISAGFSGLPYANDGVNGNSIPAPIGQPAHFKNTGAGLVSYGAVGLSIIQENPGAQAKGMVAYITNAYPGAWQVGDSRALWLCDTVAETITASGELVTNGTFATDTSGWAASSAVLSVDANRLKVVANSAGNGFAYQVIPTVVGKTYALSVDITAGVNANELAVGVGAGSESNYASGWGVGSNSIKTSFVATSTSTTITCYVAPNTGVAYFDNISVKLTDADRSVKNNGLIINGSITKAAVATGAQLVAYSGFSASNYLRQPYNANLDFGTGDFTYLGHYLFGTQAAHPQVIFQRGVGAGAILLQENGAYIYLLIHDGTSMVQIANWPLVSNERVHFVVTRIGGVLYIYLRGVLVLSGVNTLSLTSAELPSLFIGNDPTLANSAINGSLCLIRASATGMTADQVAHAYRTELALFQPNAQCTIDGTSAAVTALAYDETADVLQVGTSWGRSAFRDLVRIESAASSVGAITSLSANQGAHITGGASSGRYYQPAMLLRDELRRAEEARKALGKVPVFFDFDAVTSQTAFVLPKGYTTKAVYSAGSLKRNGATKDYTTSFDGFAETVTFGTAPGNTVWVSIMCVRSN